MNYGLNQATQRKMQRKIRKNKRKRKRAFGKLTGAICLTAFMVGKTYALPQDGNVVAGTASILRPSHTEMLINQMTNKAIINWKSFDIAQNELVRFNQPSSVAIALNRVVGKDPSEIFGQLIANGRIFLVNPNGILFGKTAQIDVAGLLATTLDIKNEDFLNGKFDFLQNPEADFASVINRGKIEVDQNGFVMLIAPSVENEGLILAKLGKVVLASGTEYQFDFTGDGLITYSVLSPVKSKVFDNKGDQIETGVLNKGTIKADGGTVILTARAVENIFSSVVNNEGIIEAKSLVEKGGKIILEGGEEGEVENSGTINVSSAEVGAEFGSISITGKEIGNTGKIFANGYEDSDAGSIYIYASESTKLGTSSDIEAKGIGKNSNGGFIEVSAEKAVYLSGILDVSSEEGKSGKVFVDPDDEVTISGYVYTGGGDYEVNATESITVENNTIISTRNTGLFVNATSQETAFSVGDSGNMTFNAPSITVNEGAKIFTFATGDYKSGNITFNATDSGGNTASSITTEITIEKNVIINAGSGTITFLANATQKAGFGEGDDAGDVFLSFVEQGITLPGGYASAKPSAHIYIYQGTEVKGGDIDIKTEAHASAHLYQVFYGANAGYTETKPEAKIQILSGNITASGNVNISSFAEESLSDYAATVNFGEGWKKGSPVNVTVAYGKADLTSEIDLDSGTSITGKKVNISATGSKDITLWALAGSYENGILGIAFSFADVDDTVNVNVSGSVKSTQDEVNITSELISQANKVSATAGVGSDKVTHTLIKSVGAIKDKLVSFFKTKASPSSSIPSSSKIDPNTFDAGAAFAILLNDADVNTKVDGDVKSQGNLNIKSTLTYIGGSTNGIQSSAIASVTKNPSSDVADYAVCVGLDLILSDDRVVTEIGSGAELNAGGDINIDSSILLPWEITWHELSVGNILSKLNSNLGIQSGFFTTWAQSTSESSNIGISGSINIGKFTEISHALIDSDAEINQAPGYNLNPGNVSVTATTEIHTVNAGGNIGLLGLGTDSKNGVGATFSGIFYDVDTEAKIDKGAKINAKSLNVLANSTSNVLTIGLSGGLAKTFGFSGVFSYISVTDNTTACVEDGTIINLIDNTIDTDTSFSIDAVNHSYIYNIVGGVALSNSTGIGLSIGINKVDRNTQASLSGDVTASKSVEVSALNAGRNNAWSLAGSVTFATPPTGDTTSVDPDEFHVSTEDIYDLSDPPQSRKKISVGIAAAGASSVNLINDTTCAKVTNATITADNLKVISKYATSNYAIGGTLALSKKDGISAGLAGAYMGNIITFDTQAYISDSTIRSGVEVQSLVEEEENPDEDLNIGMALGGGGSVSWGGNFNQNFALIGSFSLNKINKTIVAYIENSTIDTTKDVNIKARDNSQIITVAGNLVFSGLSAGAAIGYAEEEGTIKAYFLNSDISASSLSISSSDESEEHLYSISAAGTSEIFAASASIGINKMGVDQSAYIKGYKTSGIKVNDVTVESNSTHSITTATGALSIAIPMQSEMSAPDVVDRDLWELVKPTKKSPTSIGIGAAVGYNEFNNNISTYIADTKIASQNIEVDTKANNDIINITLAGSVSKVGIAFNVGINKVNENISTYIENSTISSQGSDKVSSIYTGNYENYGGSLGGASYLGIGGTGTGNIIENTINSYIVDSDIEALGKSEVEVDNAEDNQSTINFRGVAVVADSRETTTTGVATGGIAKGGVSINGAVSVDIFKDHTKAYISNSHINTPHSVSVKAFHKSTSSVGDGGLSFGEKAGIGIAAGAVSFKDETLAYIDSNSTINAGKNVIVNSLSREDALLVSVAGAISGEVSLAGSIGVVYSNALTSAYIDNSTIKAYGVDVNATNTFKLDKDDTAGFIIGSTAVTTGVAGVGGGVGVVKVKNRTYAFVSGSEIEGNLADADSVLNISANSTNEIYYAIANVAAGRYAGVGGSVGVISISDITKAFTSKDSSGRNTKIKISKVNVKSYENTDIEGGVGQGSGALYGAAGAAINVISIHGENDAFIGDDTVVNADQEVNVLAQTNRNIDTRTIAFGGGGLLGAQGTVSVINIGASIESDDQKALGNTASVVDTNITNPFSFNTGDEEVNQEIQDAISDGSIAEDLDANSKLVDVTTSAIGKNAKITISGLSLSSNLNVEAKHYINVDSRIGGGAAGLIGVGGSVNIVRNFSNVNSHIGDNSEFDIISGGIYLLGDRSFDATLITYAGSAGGTSLGAAVSYLYSGGDLNTFLGNKIKISGTRSTNVKIEGNTRNNINVDSIGNTGGTVVAGAVVSKVTLEGNTNVYTLSQGIWGDSNFRLGEFSLLSNENDQIDVYSIPVNVGAISADAVVSEINYKPIIKSSLGGSTLYNSDDVNVESDLTYTLSSEAKGINIGVFTAGGSVSEVYNYPEVKAIVNGATVDSKGAFSLKAEISKDSSTYSKATATHGGALLGITGSRAAIEDGSIVKAETLSGSNIAAEDGIYIYAKNYSDNVAYASGVSAGGVLALGLNSGSITYNATATANLGNHTSLNSNSGDIYISALNSAYIESRSVAGSGGVVSGDASKATTEIKGTTKISTDENVNLFAGGKISLNSERNIRFNSFANSVNACVLGMSGSHAKNSIYDEYSKIILGSNNNFEATEYEIIAIDKLNKYWSSDYNAKEGSGGVFEGSSCESKTKVENSGSFITFKSGSNFKMNGDYLSDNKFLIKANNVFYFHDKVKLSSGGLTDIADADSIIQVNTNISTEVKFEDNVNVNAMGSVIVCAATKASAYAEASAYTYGGYSSAEAFSKSSIWVNDKITLSDGTTIEASKDVTLMAGEDDKSFGYIDTTAYTDVYNKALIPYEGSPDADASSVRFSTITIPTGAKILTGQDINITSTLGNLDAYGYGKATDLYRELIEKIKEWFGDDDASEEKTAGTSYKDGIASVIIDGTLQTGIYRHQYVTFGKDFDPGFYVVNYPGSDGKTKYKLVPNVAIRNGDGYDIYDENENYIKTIKPSEISNGISWSLVTDTAIGVHLDNRLQELEELKANYSGDDTTKQDLEAEIALIKTELEDSAMYQTTHIIKLDKVFATSGDINIHADILKGSGELNAPGDVSIKILNYSPLPLEVGTLEIPWNHGGHIRFNGLSVHNNNDIANINKESTTPEFSITDGENSPAPLIKVQNFYEKTPYAQDPEGNVLYMYPPPILVGYSTIENEASGNTYVTNLGGEVFIKSTGSIIVTEGISANTIKLDAGGNFIFNNANAIFSVLGSPKSQFNATATTAFNLVKNWRPKTYKNSFLKNFESYYPYEDSLDLINPYQGYTIAGNNIFINANIININGVIQSGIPDRVVTINPASNGGIELSTISLSDLNGDSYTFSPTDDTPKFFIFEDGEPVIAEGIKAKLKDGKIYVSDVSVQGGTVFLSGKIINTGNSLKKGWINVVDGYGKIEIINNTNYPIVLKGIDTGGIEGKVTIIDKNRDNKGEKFDPDKDKYYYTIEYIRKGNTIEVYDNYGIDSSKPIRLKEKIEGRIATFKPLENMYYYWTSGISTGNETYSKYVHDFKKFLGFIPVGDVSYLADWLVEEETKELSSSELPQGDIVGVYPDYNDGYVIKHTQVTSLNSKYVKVTVDHFWKGLSRYTRLIWDVYEYKTTNDYYFSYVKADYPIKIHFTGYDEGEVNILSSSPVEIAGPIRNPVGTTNIKGSSINMDNIAFVQGGTINLSSESNIGDKNAPIKITGGIINGKTVTPEVNIIATGDVNLEGVNTAMKVSSIITYGDINITSDKDLIFKSYNPFKGTSLSGSLLKGKNIYLKSTYGKVAAEGDAFINVDTNDTAGGILTVLAGTGDIKIRELTGDLHLYQAKTSGDVYIEAPFGNLVDANPNELKDERTIDQLKKLWNDIGLTGEGAEKLKEQQVQSYNHMMELQYLSYWRNYRDLKINPDGTYSYSPYKEVEFKLSDEQVASLKSAGWTDEMIQEYEDKMTRFYNKWGKESFDPNFKYDVETEDPDQYKLLTDNTWTDNQLEHPLPSFLFKKNVTDTVYVNEEPNILGHDIYLFVGGSVGRDKADIVYNYSNPASVPQEEKDRVYLALASAEIGDVRIDPEKKEIIIHQRDDIDLKATGKVTAIAGGPVYLGSDSSVTVHNLYSRDDQVRLKVYENILASAGILNVNAPQGLVLEAAYGGIGTAESPLSLYLNEGKPLTARARKDIHLFVPNGNLYVGYIYTPETLTLSVPNGIVRDYFGDVNIDINVEGATFVAAGLGDLGGPDNALNLDLSNGDLTLYITGNANLTVDSAVNLKESAVKGAFYLDTYGNLNVAGDVFVGEAEFTSQGDITLSGQLLASTGHLFLSAKGDLSAKQALNAADWMRLEAKGDISLSGPVYGQTSLNISAGEAFESIAPLTTDKGTLSISAGGDISVSDSLFGSQGVTITGGGNSSFIHNAGDIFSYGDILISGISDFYQAGSLTNHPSIISSQKVDIEASGNIVLNGDLLAEDLNLRSSGGNITLTNRVEGYTGVNIESYGNLTSTWAIFTEGDLTIKSKKGSISLWTVQGKKSANIIAGTEDNEGSADLTITENGLVASFGNVLIQASGDILNQGYLSSKGSLTITSLYGNIELHDQVHGAPGEDAYTAKFKYINALNEAIGVLNDHLDDLENNRDQMVERLQWINQNFESWVDASSNSWRTYRDYFSAIENTPLFQDTVHFVFGDQFDEFIPPKNIPLNPVLEIVSSVDLPSKIPTLDISSPNIDVTSPPEHEVRITASGFIISDATIGAGQDLFISGGVLDLAGIIGGENIYTTSARETTLEDGAILYASQDLQMDAGESFESGAYLLAGGAIKLSGESNILVRNFVFSAANVLEYATSLGLPNLFKTLAQGGENGVEIRSKGATKVEGMVLSPGNISFSSGSDLRVDGLILSASGVPQVVSKLLAEKSSVQPEDLDSLAFSVLEQSADVNAIEIESGGQVEITGFGTYAAGKVSVKGKSLDLAANIFGAEDEFELAHAFRQTFGSVLAYGSNVEIKAGSFLEEPLGLVLSLVGEVHLSTTDGNVEVSTVGAPRGKIFVTSAGGIFDHDHGTIPTDVDLYASEVELVAISGIGTPNNFLDIRTSKLGAVTETGGLYLAIANDKDLHLGHTVAGSGDVHLELYGANLWVDDLVEACKGGVVLKVPQGFILGDGRLAAIKESTLVAGKYIGLPFRPLEVDINNRLNIGIFGKDAHYGFSTYLKGITRDQFLHFLNLTPGLTALNNVTKGGRPQDDFFFGTGIEIENTAGEVFRHFPGLHKPMISGFEERMNEGLFELETNSPQSEQEEAVSLHKKFKKWVRKLTTFMRRTDV